MGSVSQSYNILRVEDQSEMNKIEVLLKVAEEKFHELEEVKCKDD